MLGATLATLGLGLVVYGLIQAGGSRAITGPPLALVGVGASFLLAFVWVERRSSTPMVPPALFSVRTFAGANLLTLVTYGALGAGLFFLPFNLIQVQGYTPSAAGRPFSRSWH